MSKFKAVFISVFTVISSFFGIVAIPFYVLIGLNLTDYITGIVAAPYRNEAISSYKGFRGIAKKICMWLLVGVGMVVDWLLSYAVATIGLALPFKYLVACLAVIWLICNELISILENINDIGVSLPPFLMPIVSKLKSTVESKGDINE
ncbi:MAG TPA: holin [Ruminococcaceae bacterium]|nr:holin [Oscillospiraceae bacterium]